MDERVRDEHQVSQLVQQAQRGDAEAFTDLVRRYHGQIYRWALVKTGDPDDADDVTQNVLVRLQQHLPGFSGRSRFTTWLYQVTRNSALELMRKKARGTRAIEKLRRETSEQGLQRDDRLEQLHQTDVAQVIKAFFDQLPERQREIFDLTDLQGFSPSEVSAMLDMKPVTVRAHLSKARRAIRKKILDRYPELVEEYSQ